jgi:hypothetical protein
MVPRCTQVEDFLSLCTYMQGPYDEDEGYVKLNQRLASWEKEHVSARPQCNCAGWCGVALRMRSIACERDR